MKQRSLIALPALAVILAACSDGSDNRGPDPIDLATPNADRCEILDAVNCMFPWPSAAFTVADDGMPTGLRVNMHVDSMPVNKAGVAIDPAEWNRNDGFSPSQMIVTQVPGLDLEQTGVPPITDLSASQNLDSPVLVIRASTGEPHLIFAELDVNTSDPAEQTFLIRPMAQFERGERYIVALRNLKDASGATLEAPEVFRAFRDAQPTTNADIEARRPAMETLFTELQAAGIERDSLYLAWDFNIASVENITGRMLHIRDEAFASLGAAAPAFTVDEVIDFAPCGDTCGDGENEHIARRIHGSFDVPNFLNIEGGPAGAVFNYESPDDGLPDRLNGDDVFVAEYVCSVPRSVAEDFDLAPKVQARPSLYGHGLLGSRGEAERGTGANVAIMSNDHQMMFCATDWYGFAGGDIGSAIEALQDVTQVPKLYDRTQQGFLAMMYLARLLKHDDGLRSNAAFRAGDVPVFDNSNVYYDGNSQGGILGGALMGVIQDVTRGVLGVPGMNYSLLLRRSIDFDTYALILSGEVTGEDGGGYPSIKDQTFILSMMQMLWDRAEASGYAYHIQDNPLPNTPAHAVMLHVAYGDHQVSMWAAEMMARAIGANLRVPALEPGRHPDSNPFVDLEPLPAGDAPGSVLVYWDDGPLGGGAGDGGTAPPPITNLPPFEPDFGEDPHSLPRKDSNAQQQKSFFLLPEGEGKFVDVCDASLPCATDGYMPGAAP